MVKVLIADDEEKNRLLLKNFFELFGEDSGIEIIEAESGEDAVTIALKEKPNLILMDVKMEDDYSGLDAAKRIKQEDGSDTILIWAITAQAMEAHFDEISDRAKAIEAGCDQYFAKPFDVVLLIQKISDVLSIPIPKKTRMRMGLN